MNAIQRTQSSDVAILTLSTASHKEFFFNLAPQEAATPAEALTRLAAVVSETGAQLVYLEVFGGQGSGASRIQLVRDAFGDAVFPVTWVEEKSGSASRVAGVQAWGVSGVQVLPLLFEGSVIGAYFDTPHSRYCRLGGVLPANISIDRKAQAIEVFQRMDAALHLCNMHFNQVPRTWFFNHHLLDWYDSFNAARDAFFREQHVYQNVVPASTGIEGGNPAGAALVADVLAVAPCGTEVSVCALPSPLQCAALEYGSSFSRATEINEPGVRRLFISGTASISPDGKTQFDGDVVAQIKRTMQVVAAILHSRGMDLSHTTRAITYFKHAEDIPAFEAWRVEANAPDIPVIYVHNDVCRHDLLFEIELDAIGASKQ